MAFAERSMEALWDQTNYLHVHIFAFSSGRRVFTFCGSVVIPFHGVHTRHNVQNIAINSITVSTSMFSTITDFVNQHNTPAAIMKDGIVRHRCWTMYIAQRRRPCPSNTKSQNQTEITKRSPWHLL